MELIKLGRGGVQGQGGGQRLMNRKVVNENIVLATCQDKYSEKVTPRDLSGTSRHLSGTFRDFWGPLRAFSDLQGPLETFQGPLRSFRDL